MDELLDDELIDIIDSIDWLEHMVNTYIDYNGDDDDYYQIEKQCNHLMNEIENATIPIDKKVELHKSILEITERLKK